ncbi:hypothetical protein BHE74_00039882 [Ensete ventricosum]|nr:hypothetical protein GW17_00029053 [Ensete ventricosum]RWW53624.1 hypothetical protein BHE74_00039882 [Ensete ventricosum]
MVAPLLSSGGSLGQSIGVKGCRSPVNYCVCPGTSPVTSCQGSGGVVRLSVAVSTLARRRLTSYHGSGGSSGTSALLRCPLIGGTISRLQGRQKMSRGWVGRRTQARRGRDGDAVTLD